MLTESQLTALEEGGCLVIEDLFNDDDLTPVKEEGVLRYQAMGQPTGRWYVPRFVARSRSFPKLETANCAT